MSREIAPDCCEVSLAERVIVSKTFRLKDGGMTICKLTLKNGHEVYGSSKAGKGIQFVPEVGEETAYTNALKKVVELESYVRKTIGLDASFWNTFQPVIIAKEEV